MKHSILRYFLQTVVVVAMIFGNAMGQTGRIEGKVTDQAGAPLPFVNITVEGTYLGAATDNDGVYFITDVPAGTYTLKTSFVSYRQESAEVTVAAGETVTQNFSLREDPLMMGEVVVTGTQTPRQKIESTVAISTLSPRDIELANPRSTTEVLRYIPGFTRVESSGGEVNQNISVRGIYGVEYVMFMEDGLPVFPTMHTFFMNADNLFRPDENIKTVEVIRGGNSALFGSNAPGAIINFINKTGGPEIGGVVKATAATKSLGRYDFNLNGPLGEDWRFNAGGFYRFDEGVRDPGYPGIRGGQFKANITRLLGNGYVRGSVKVINDRNQFILPLPFQNPTDPQYVDGFSDYGAMTTPEGNHIRVPIPTGELELPLDNGLRTEAYWLTADVGFEFPGGWGIQNIAQTMQNNQEWNAIVPFNIMPVADYITSLNLPAGSTAQLSYTNQFDATGANLAFNANSTPNGLIAPSGEWHVEKPLSAFQNQFTLTKSVGEHNFSAGFYFANYTQTNRWYFTEILTDVRDNPQFVDVQVTDAQGNITQRTSNGFTRYLSNYVNGSGSTTIFSGVIGGELKLTPQLRVDLGGRWESDKYVQSSENTSPIDLDGDPNTPYDVEPWGNGSFRHFSRTLDDYAISLGANYAVNSQFALYAQASRGYKMPALDEFLNAQAQAQIDVFENQETRLAEAGVKYSSPMLGFSIGGYWGELKNIVGQGAEVDPNTGVITWVVRPSPESRSYGAELEFSARPASGFTVFGAGTYVKPQTLPGTGAALTAGGIPDFLTNLAATYTISGLTFKADWHYVGTRDLINSAYDVDQGVYTTYEKVGELKAYNYFNVGAMYRIPAQPVSISLDVLNVNQSKGFEEGNPRLPAAGGAEFFLARPLLPRRAQLAISYQF